MPSVIGTDPNSGVNVAANYLKAQPSTRFGTRELVVAVITVDNVELATGYQLSNSDFSKAIRTIQNIGELYAVGTPVNNEGNGTFTVLLSGETLGDNNFVDVNNDNDGATNIEYMLHTLFEENVTVDFTSLFGGGFN